MNIPPIDAALSLYFCVVGKGVLVALNLKLGFPVEALRIDSYMN
jgi:hypothetical protein